MLNKITDPVALKILIGIIFVLKLTVSFNTALFEDEAIYWNWSLSPDPSYSFTTLIAIKLFTMIPGYLNEFTVRLPALLTNFVILFFFIKTGRLLGFAENRILLTALFLFSIPFVTIYTSFISPDTMLLMFSVISVYFSVRVIKIGSYLDWILCGVSFGLMILSKYTGAVFVSAFAIFILYKRNDLKGFSTGKFIAFISALLLVITPLLLWNFIYEPVWLNHYLISDADYSGNNFAGRIQNFILSQAAILLPAAFVMFMFIIVSQILNQKRSTEENYLLFSGIFILISFAVLSLTGKSKGNWAFTAFIPLVYCFLFVRKNIFSGIVLTLMVGLNLLLLIILNLNSAQIKSLADNEFGKYINSTFRDYWQGHTALSTNDRSWEERILKMKNRRSSIHEIEKVILSIEPDYDFIASDNFTLSPLLKFYLRKNNVYLLGDLRFKYINSAEVNKNLMGKDAIVITYGNSDIGYLQKNFEELKEIRIMRFVLSDELTEEFRIIHGKNYKPESVYK
ncbi:MAG: glycosyltransferase family 39 protein [Ignavibacteria bacterium]|nr:glycosyltransferase family 39 protein [Ignavibacteria bacterium]